MWRFRRGHRRPCEETLREARRSTTTTPFLYMPDEHRAQCQLVAADLILLHYRVCVLEPRPARSALPVLVLCSELTSTTLSFCLPSPARICLNSSCALHAAPWCSSSRVMRLLVSPSHRTLFHLLSSSSSSTETGSSSAPVSTSR